MFPFGKKQKKYNYYIIRFKRRGTIKNPNFDIVLVNVKAKSSTGKYIDKLGHYNPVLTEKIFYINIDKLAYWVSKGAKVHKTVKKYLVKFLVI